MTPIDIGTIIIALIAAVGAWSAQHTAASATKSNTTVSGKIAAEKEAYQRASSFDIQTIERQSIVIDELLDDNKELRKELVTIKKRLARLEALSPDFVERLKDEGYYQSDDG